MHSYQGAVSSNGDTGKLLDFMFWLISFFLALLPSFHLMDHYEILDCRDHSRILLYVMTCLALGCHSLLAFASPIRVNLTPPGNTFVIFHIIRQPLFWLCIPLVLFLSCMPQVLILYIRRTYFYRSSDILQEVA